MRIADAVINRGIVDDAPPPGWCFRSGRNAFDIRYVMLRLTSTNRCQSPSDKPVTDDRKLLPALSISALRLSY